MKKLEQNYMQNKQNFENTEQQRLKLHARRLPGDRFSINVMHVEGQCNQTSGTTRVFFLPDCNVRRKP